MKKTIILVVLVSFLTLTFSGCFGSFALTRKLYEINRTALEDRVLQSLVTWAFVVFQVYSFCAFVDWVLLNTIEFYTGSNPLAMGEGESEQKFYTSEDKTYEVITTKNRYDINEVGNLENSFSFVFEAEESSWYLHSQGQIFKVTEDHGFGLKLFDFDGNVLATL